MHGHDGPGGAEFPSAASERLAGLGLARAPVGWVPDQPAVPPVADPAPDPALTDATAPALGEALRSAVASRLPLWAADRVERVAPGTLLLVVLAVVVLGIVGVVHLRHHPSSGSSYASSYAAGTPTSSGGGGGGATTGTDLTSDATSIVVDVGGRVHKPGLVTLPLGARVADAIDAAGGPLHPRELARIDLAQRVTDGQLLLVGVQPTSGQTDAGGTSTGTTGPVSLSAASLEALETLPGVGPVTAQKIIDWRTAHGGFSSVDQLKQVPGIGPAHYAEISPLVTP